jgi:hypothetical protein
VSAQAVLSTVRGGGWVAAGLRTGGGTSWLDADLRPVEDLHRAGLSWAVVFVQPLQTVIDQLAGKGSVIQSFVTTWQQVASSLDEAGGLFSRTAPAETVSWEGEAADGYRTWAARTAESVRNGSALASATSEAARLMGEVVGNARKDVADLVGRLVNELTTKVPRLVAAEGGVTSGVVDQVTAAVESYRTPIADIERNLLTTVSNLRPLLVSGSGATPVAEQDTAATTRGIVTADTGLILVAGGRKGGFGGRKTTPGGGQGQPGKSGDDAESWWQKLWPFRRKRDPHDDLSDQDRTELRDKLWKEYRKREPHELPSQTNAEDALRGGPQGSKINVGGDGADVKWKVGDDVVAGRELKVIDGGNRRTFNERMSDAKEQLVEVKPGGTKEIWFQIQDGSKVTKDDLPGLMSDWRAAPWRKPEEWQAFNGIDVTFKDPAGRVLGRFDAGTGLPKP